MQEAARSPHHREVYVAAPIGSSVVEGYVDLLYERGDGIVVVDYKTDDVTSPAEATRKAQRYRYQGAAYAVAAARIGLRGGIPPGARSPGVAAAMSAVTSLPSRAVARTG